MAGNLTDWGEEKFLRHAFGVTTYTPGTLYVALYTADPGESGSQTSEVAGAGYARVALSSQWATDHITNAGDLDWSNLPATTVRHVAILDAATGGNMIWKAGFVQAVTIPAGFPFRINAQSMIVRLD